MPQHPQTPFMVHFNHAHQVPLDSPFGPLVFGFDCLPALVGCRVDNLLSELLTEPVNVDVVFLVCIGPVVLCVEVA